MKILKILLIAFFLGFASFSALAEPININTAPAKVLAKKLQGIGPKAAMAIIAYREKHGPFKSVDELKKIKGIGPKTVAKNRKNMIVGSAK